ncbi:3'-5' exonuclease [Marinobacterium weihaiense]|uniref:Exonuclease domain-containing protein n=1 Tax=Marinobacterium weihaiense TaxID=2851016 RepID=A0ABS6MAN8_9GAMM|nr:3'-5' exonuclease [Marinobacterium weihaiense]MBV0932936.1 exonuclease domain-containing protein [Marinobacterium weihaiense]
MEIIELGCVLASSKGQVLAERSFMVRPQHHPVLSAFCQQLTTITQSMVDRAPVYVAAMGELNSWLSTLPPVDCWASWGNYDRRHLVAQSRREGVSPDVLALPHLNLKTLWKRTTGQRKRNGLSWALQYHHLEFEGQLHRGIDDARNMARLLPFMDWSQTDGATQAVPYAD